MPLGLRRNQQSGESVGWWRIPRTGSGAVSGTTPPQMSDQWRSNRSGPRIDGMAGSRTYFLQDSVWCPHLLTAADVGHGFIYLTSGCQTSAISGRTLRNATKLAGYRTTWLLVERRERPTLCPQCRRWCGRDSPRCRTEAVRRLRRRTFCCCWIRNPCR